MQLRQIAYKLIFLQIILFVLGKTSKLQIDFSYTSPFKSGLYEVGYASSFDIGFKQDLFNKTMQIAFLANDIFNTSYLKDYTSVVML